MVFLTMKDINKDIKFIAIIVAFLFLLMGVLLTYNFFITKDMFEEIKSLKTTVTSLNNKLDDLEIINIEY